VVVDAAVVIMGAAVDVGDVAVVDCVAVGDVELGDVVVVERVVVGDVVPYTAMGDVVRGAVCSSAAVTVGAWSCRTVRARLGC
jgi:hypothetical protein